MAELSRPPLSIAAKGLWRMVATRRVNAAFTLTRMIRAPEFDLRLSSSKKEADQYGKTHSVSIDTWKPEAKKVEKVEEESKDLPF